MTRLHKIVLLTGLLSVPFATQIGNAQPPPPPPPGGPPCWPPPCIPVDGGIVAAFLIAGLFGAYIIFSRMKSEPAR